MSGGHISLLPLSCGHGVVLSLLHSSLFQKHQTLLYKSWRAYLSIAGVSMENSDATGTDRQTNQKWSGMGVHV